MDIVYIVRPGDDNDELKHSLRSVAANVKNVGRVWIAGTVPSWVSWEVSPIPLVPKDEKFANIRASLQAVVDHPEMPERFVVFNDDHFVVEPVDAEAWPTYHLGPLSGFIRHLLEVRGINPRNTWFRGLQHCADYMLSKGHPDPLAYEGHVPFVVDRDRLKAVLSDFPREWFFTYGALYDLIGGGGVGERAGNVKVAQADSLESRLALDMPFLSSNDHTFATAPIGAHVRALFPDPCLYETEGAQW